MFSVNSLETSMFPSPEKGPFQKKNSLLSSIFQGISYFFEAEYVWILNFIPPNCETHAVHMDIHSSAIDI